MDKASVSLPMLQAAPQGRPAAIDVDAFRTALATASNAEVCFDRLSRAIYSTESR